MRLLRAFIPVLMLLGVLAFPVPSTAAVAVGISVGIAPPLLPVYEQPLIPGPGYIWTPGYWAWGPDGYYWVPGTWVLPPAIGLLWTPPWWGWSDGVYVFNAGYWGPTVGFYGGINYGFGYFGRGYDGGRWDHGRFFYNREVNNIRNANITNVYSRSVSGNVSASRSSFNGGTGGVTAAPTAREQAAMREHHLQATGAQLQQVNAARSNRALLATANHGDPPIKATPRAGRFSSAGNATSLGATRQSTIQPNTRTTQGTVGAGARASQSFGQASTRNLTQSAPGHSGHTNSLGATRPSTVQPNGRTTPSTVGPSARPSRNVGQAPTGNVTRTAPGHFGQAAPRSLTPPSAAGRAPPRPSSAGTPRNFAPQGPSMARPSSGPHFAGPHGANPTAHPVARGGGGAPQERRHGP